MEGVFAAEGIEVETVSIGTKAIQGCIGCGLCVKACPEQAIRVENNLAVIDYTKCNNCGLCATVCPKKIIEVYPIQEA